MMSNTVLMSADDCALVGEPTGDSEDAALEAAAEPAESFEQKISGSSLLTIEFEEGRPWSRPATDPALEAFRTNLREAEAIERQITDIEKTADENVAKIKASLAPLVTQQILACYRAGKLVAEGRVPPSAMEEYALEAGIKEHGNEKVPWSRLMRAIIANGEIKGTQISQRKRARASTYASAIDFGIREGMTPEEFTAELERPRKRGERHGIEHLAEQGRRARRAATFERSADQVADALKCLHDGGAFVVSGDFSGVEPGYRLVVINVLDGTPITETRGQIIDPIDEAIVQRVLRQWIMVRRPAEAADGARSSAQYDLAGSLGELAKTVNSMRLN
jgi:hypothetical protein